MIHLSLQICNLPLAISEFRNDQFQMTNYQ
jgi:hypothetical protein